MNYLLKDASEFVASSGRNGPWELPGFLISGIGMVLAVVICGICGKDSGTIWLI